jgi:transcriptional regulator with XRE-family HTH domain
MSSGMNDTAHAGKYVSEGIRMSDRSSDGFSPSAIGERLRITREVIGLSQAELADSCGIARNTYNQYETGTNVPQIGKAISLCDKFGLTLDWIYRGDPSGLSYRMADAIKALRAKHG